MQTQHGGLFALVAQRQQQEGAQALPLGYRKGQAFADELFGPGFLGELHVQGHLGLGVGERSHDGLQVGQDVVAAFSPIGSGRDGMNAPVIAILEEPGLVGIGRLGRGHAHRETQYHQSATKNGTSHDAEPSGRGGILGRATMGGQQTA